jgi:hypothetical protein
VSSPGWFPDPLGRYEFRYHNGQHWTSDVASGGNRTVDPLGVAPTPWPPATGGAPTPDRPGRGFAIAALVLGIAAVLTSWIPFVVVLGLAATVLAIVFGVIGRRRSRVAGQPSGVATAGLALGVIAVPMVVLGAFLTQRTWTEVQAYLEPGPHIITTDDPCTIDDDVVTYTGTIENLSDRDRGYTVQVRIRVDDRRSVLRQVTVDEIAAGETGDWRMASLVSGTSVECRVDDVFGPTPFGMPMQP